MRIGQVARLAGVSTRTIRYYHRLGLLPEPARDSNGYRSYALDDVVALLRIRRLTALGLALDEVRNVLAEDGAADLDDVLTELDADLARRAEAIQRQRQRIADLRGTLSAGVPRDEVADIADRLAEIYSGAETTVEIEHSLLEVFTELDPQVTSLYRSALADENMAARGAELATCFEALATADPGDDEVECLARDIVACSRELGEMARGELERIDFGGRFGTDDLLDALTGADELSDAQRRCVQRMVALGRQAWS
ncbi:MerR family transcriptional regulator [Gordonia polyisoprenivorans]|uniref:helix-turn-helix domain-containing protein n=1 Tax=Gordonia polyisoprenivorans TaxID=84595 RepID=UPI0030D57F43